MTSENPLCKPLKNLQAVCLKQNIPFVSFRLPFNEQIVTFIQHDSFPEKLDTIHDIDEKVGFVMAPFDENTGHATHFMKPNSIVFPDEIDSDYIQKLSKNNRFLSVEKLSEKDIESSTSTKYINNVETAKAAIAEGKFHKVVLSKIRLEKLDDDFVVEDFFLKLCDKYPHAMVYLIQLPDVGCWVGATPEPLLVIEDECVKTVSLAGTQLATGVDVDSYSWSQKEIEEQGIVTNFVEETLRSLNIKNYDKTGPINYQAANLIHLKTAFEFPQADLRNRLGDFLKALHPTPSVGGLPKAEAREFILANEKYDRSYYTGFLGPVNINKNSYIFVNLRCLQLFDKQFALYSGAGITASSIAENEWEETDNKMMTMMNVMKS